MWSKQRHAVAFKIRVRALGIWVRGITGVELVEEEAV